MKRSEINRRIAEAEAFFEAMRFPLPPWARWTPRELRVRCAADQEIFANSLGWDLTDFGSGDFERRGLILFTLRNGNPARDSKPYAEKAMIVGEGQETPLHFHWSKTEDIIVRGGGRLAMQLWPSNPDEGLASGPLRLSVDGIAREIEAGGSLSLGPGESVCLEPGVFHRFYAERGSGKVLAGEVSSVNDDGADNRFYERVGRFPDIDEDEAPYRLLVSDYRPAGVA